MLSKISVKSKVYFIRMNFRGEKITRFLAISWNSIPATTSIDIRESLFIINEICESWIGGKKVFFLIRNSWIRKNKK